MGGRLEGPGSGSVQFKGGEGRHGAAPATTGPKLLVAGGGSGDPFWEGGRGKGSGDCRVVGGTAATGELRGGVGSLVAPNEGGRLFTSSSGSVCSGGSGLYSLVISARPGGA